MATIVTLMLVGAGLLLLETILPGLISGLVGLGCLVAAVIVAYSDYGTRIGNAVLGIVVFGLVVGTLAWMRFFPESRMAQRLVSKGSVGNIDAERRELLNETGTALTALRPSGMALIRERRIDVVTEGAMVARGTPIKVIAVEGMRVVVRALQ